MKKYFLPAFAIAIALGSCSNPYGEKINSNPPKKAEQKSNDFQYIAEGFADIQVLRYNIPGWENLSLKQKKLAYFLTQAGYAGRDIIWDQNYRHNLAIRTALEHIYTSYKGDKTTKDWNNFKTYLKRVWFSNGIHHHYSMNKIMPEFSKEYLNELMINTSTELHKKAIEAIFSPEVDAKKVSLDPNKDLLLASATNFYDPTITEAEANQYYKSVIDREDPKPISYGLNSKLIKNEDGTLTEEVYHLNGMYGKAIAGIISWLEKAVNVTENGEQKKGLELLIEYYKTGDLKLWDEYNIVWSSATDGDIDYINSFIEVYNDPIGMRGSYESIVEIKDFDMSAKMEVLANSAQWFEDNSPILPENKKENVIGVSYKVVNVAGESGDASPSTPIGVNLPNSNWIRSTHGSKSVSLGNIVQAYNNAGKGSMLEEFCNDKEELDRVKAHSKLASKLHTAMHEVIGHASGKINDGIGTPKETLKSYASTLEEARADLVALYYLMDNKLVELGLMPSLEVGKAEYDNYIRNGLMTQLIRIEEGEVIEEAHMRNRQLVSAWVYEKGAANNVIVWEKRDGKSYLDIKNYEELRVLFGQLLMEIQRIKSEGDYQAGKDLVENYGVQVNEELHKEVLKRAKKLSIPPYSGFINPTLKPVMDGDTIKNIKATYNQNFDEQMLYYSERFGFLK